MYSNLFEGDNKKINFPFNSYLNTEHRPNRKLCTSEMATVQKFDIIPEYYKEPRIVFHGITHTNKSALG
jgi:hypothetical protein